MFYFSYQIASFALFLVSHLPVKVCYWISNFFAMLSFLLFYKQRRKVFKNLKRILRDKDKKKIRSIAFNLYKNFVANIVDYLLLFTREKKWIEDRFIVDGVDEKLKELASSKKGIIIATAHLGNWEAAGFILGYMGYRAHGIGLPQPDERMENLYKKMREKGNVVVHPFPGGVIGVYKALKNNEVASIVSDRDINKDGIKTRFFGKCVTFPGGAALLAYRTGARSIFGFAVKEKGKYKACVSHEIIIDRSKGEKAFIEEYVKKFASLLEEYVKKYPDRWYHFFDYFEEYKC
ncbi:MAG: lysophospholipid acyltransferase family protein [Caldisericota bacterium]|nr:lysophospholipid acyltransferase family protein [Caldisericota bacterium]